jgi:hypothetical protein
MLVNETILYYDARSEKHQTDVLSLTLINVCATDQYFRLHIDFVCNKKSQNT